MSNIEIINFGLLSALIGITIFVILQMIILFKKVHFRYLTLFFFSNLMTNLDELIWTFRLWKYAPWLVNLYLPFLFLMAPAIFFYTHTLTKQQAPLKRPHWFILWGGFCFALILCLPYFILDRDIKIERLNAAKDTLEHLSYITQLPIFLLLIFLPFSLLFLRFSFLHLSSNLIKVKTHFSTLKNKDLSWIRWMMLTLTFAFIIAIFELFLPSRITEFGVYKTAFLLLEIFWVSIFAYFGLKQTSVLIPCNNQKPPLKQKYAKSKIIGEECLLIENKLISAMKNQKRHQDPLLTLSKLSSYIGVSENNISQILSQVMRQNFYDFINSWRIKDACSKLKQHDTNLLQIAYDVGFNSRSTFNSAFKKHTGKTPSQFRNEQKAKKCNR